MAREHLVVLGFGMAAAHLCQQLVDLGYEGQVTVVGAEPDAAYNRIDLAARAAGGPEPQALLGDDVLRHPRFQFLLGAAARGVDLAARTVLVGQQTLTWDKLVFATGARPLVPPVPGLEAASTLRTLAEAKALAEALRPGSRVVVLGGGVLGLETSDSLLGAGLAVTVVQALPRVLETRLDEPSSRLVERRFRERGLTLHLGDPATALEDGAPKRLRLASGVVLEADAVLVCAGVAPDTALAQAAGLTVARGLVVDARMTTSHPCVLAIGDVCEFEGQTTGLITPAYEQARVAARVLCGQTAAYHRAAGTAVKLKASVPVLALGSFPPPAEAVLVEASNPVDGVLQRLWVKDDRLVAAALVGDDAGMEAAEAYHLGLLPLPRPLSKLFDAADVASWPDGQVVCSCHAVTAGALRTGAKGSGRAGSGCGSCQHKVAALRQASATTTRLIKGYTVFNFTSYVIDYVMAAGFVVSMVTGILKFPGLLGALGVSLRTMPMPLIMDLHDWGSLAFTAAALAHLVLHWNPMVKFVADLLRRK